MKHCSRNQGPITKHVNNQDITKILYTISPMIMPVIVILEPVCPHCWSFGQSSSFCGVPGEQITETLSHSEPGNMVISQFQAKLGPKFFLTANWPQKFFVAENLATEFFWQQIGFWRMGSGRGPICRGPICQFAWDAQKRNLTPRRLKTTQTRVLPNPVLQQWLFKVFFFFNLHWTQVVQSICHCPQYNTICPYAPFIHGPSSYSSIEIPSPSRSTWSEIYTCWQSLKF